MKGLITTKHWFFALTIGFFAFISCEKTAQRKPDYILSEEEMVKALAEVYIAEQKVSRLQLNADSAAVVFGSMEKKVFSNLNVPDSVFRASLDYYMDHPKQMEKIYGVLVDSLQLREQRAPRQPVE
ncbi:MAG TPA: DUF4296 domain-containing protein [Chryseosolibacter sp.]